MDGNLLDYVFRVYDFRNEISLWEFKYIVLEK